MKKSTWASSRAGFGSLPAFIGMIQLWTAELRVLITFDRDRKGCIMSGWRNLCFGVGLLVLVAGCNSKNPNASANVSGNVTYKGQPVKGGTIVFVSKAELGTVTVHIGADGKFSAVDLPTGDFTVTVETESVNTAKKAPEYTKGKNKMPEYKPPGAPSTSGPDPANYVKIPSKYNSAKTSPLTATLSTGKNTVNFDLTD